MASGVNIAFEMILVRLISGWNFEDAGYGTATGSTRYIDDWIRLYIIFRRFMDYEQY